MVGKVEQRSEVTLPLGSVATLNWFPAYISKNWKALLEKTPTLIDKKS